MNPHLNQMVNALVNGANDEAKQHLSQYFNEVGAKMVNDPPVPPPAQVNESCAFDVYKDGKLIDTVFYSSDKETAEDVKKSLVDHDGYDHDIVVKKVRKSKKDKPKKS